MFLTVPGSRALPAQFWLFLLLSMLSGGGGLHAQAQAQASSKGVGAQALDSVSMVMGRVLEVETGRPLYGAAVSLASGPEGTRGVGTRVTGEDGAFLFRTVPPGLYQLSVTLVGYEDLRDTLRVVSESDLEVVLPLSVSPVELRPILVEGQRRRPAFMEGFESRRRTLGGTFFSREEIESRVLLEFTDLLRMVPGARVVPVYPYGHSVRFRGRCVPEVWVDGTRVMSTSDLDSFLRPEDLEAVEVYSGAQLPAQFGPSACGAIVVWTRTGEPDTSPNSLLRQILIGVGFATLAFLLSG